MTSNQRLALGFGKPKGTTTLAFRHPRKDGRWGEGEVELPPRIPRGAGSKGSASGNTFAMLFTIALNIYNMPVDERSNMVRVLVALRGIPGIRGPGRPALSIELKLIFGRVILRVI